ncbi:hypothetical protein A3K63_05595 [Candidatus Micrarchaeota archaeon RBG_16_49_10]|nr:MAG: hypothetical protein A3K63_05595 [Candidatus Micrarchaeota archaeon RBG_16_49_10]
MSDCIFCKIVAGEIPGFKVYEDQETLAFLDVMPRSRGMCIVVPKKHYHRFDEDMDTSSKAFDAAIVVAEKIQRSLNPLAIFFSVLEAQVPHFHVRVYPAYQDSIPLIENKPMEVDQKQLMSLAEKIRSVEVGWKRKERVVEVVREVKAEKPAEEPRKTSGSSWAKRMEDLA